VVAVCRVWCARLQWLVVVVMVIAVSCAMVGSGKLVVLQERVCFGFSGIESNRIESQDVVWCCGRQAFRDGGGGGGGSGWCFFADRSGALLLGVGRASVLLCNCCGVDFVANFLQELFSLLLCFACVVSISCCCMD
jgi:hypothetical protein